MKIGQIKKAQGVIEGGTWVKSPILPGVEHHVRGLSCAAAEKRRRELIEALPAAERLDGLSDAAQEEIEAHVIADVVWLGTKGIEEEDGSVFDVSTPDARLAKLTDPELKILRNDVRQAALRVGADILTERERAAKN